MKIVTSSTNVSGTFHSRHTVEIHDGPTMLISVTSSTSMNTEAMRAAAQGAIHRLRYLADDAERELRRIGILAPAPADTTRERILITLREHGVLLQPMELNAVLDALLDVIIRQ